MCIVQHVVGLTTSIFTVSLGWGLWVTYRKERIFFSLKNSFFAKFCNYAIIWTVLYLLAPLQSLLQCLLSLYVFFFFIY